MSSQFCILLYVLTPNLTILFHPNHNSLVLIGSNKITAICIYFEIITNIRYLYKKHNKLNTTNNKLE